MNQNPLQPAARSEFDPAVFLATAGLGRSMIQVKTKDVFFLQGDAAKHVFYLQTAGQS